MTDEQKLSDRLTEAHVQIGRRDSMIEHLKAEAIAQREKIGMLHEKIGRMGAVNDQLMNALANIIDDAPYRDLTVEESAVLKMAIEEKDSNYE